LPHCSECVKNEIAVVIRVPLVSVITPMIRREGARRRSALGEDVVSLHRQGMSVLSTAARATPRDVSIESVVE
jgi:hypothetical protein